MIVHRSALVSQSCSTNYLRRFVSPHDDLTLGIDAGWRHIADPVSVRTANVHSHVCACCVPCLCECVAEH